MVMVALDALHNSGVPVAVGSGWAATHLLAAISTATGKKKQRSRAALELERPYGRLDEGQKRKIRKKQSFH